MEGLRPVNGAMLISWGIGSKVEGDRTYFRQGLVKSNDAVRIGVRRSRAGRNSIVISMNMLKVNLVWFQSSTFDGDN